MITININPIVFSIGSLSVRWYGLMYVVGITIGLLVAWPYAKWKGFTDDQLEKVVYWAVPAGLSAQDYTTSFSNLWDRIYHSHGGFWRFGKVAWLFMEPFSLLSL